MNKRNMYERSGYIEQSHYSFREVREFLQKYTLANQMDVVIFLSVGASGMDDASCAKLNFYIDKLAKSAAAKARNQSVAIVTGGTIGLMSLLPRLIKTYTGAKAVQITTIGVSPYFVTDAGKHNKEIIADNQNIFPAGTGFDYHILTGAPIGTPLADANSGDLSHHWGSEANAMYEIMSGMVSNVGHLSCIYANGGMGVLREFMFVRRAHLEGIDVTAIILQGSGRVSDAMLEYLDGKPASGIVADNGRSLEALASMLANEGFALDNIMQSASKFIMHTLNGSLPDILPTGVTLDKTGKPAWQTSIETKSFL